MDRKKVTELKLESLVLYLKTSLGGLFGLLLKTILILLFFYFLKRKQFVCFEPYFSFIECATKKSYRGEFLDFNRYRRGLETCPQAKTSKSGHAIFFSFFRRVRATSMTQHRVENTRVHFWTFSPVSVNRYR